MPFVDLVAQLHAQGAKIDATDISSACRTLDAPGPVARFLLGTKAQTLARLRGVVRKSRILDQCCFTHAE